MAATSTFAFRPAFMKEEHLEYLDELFESYAVDIRRAGPMLSDAFGIDETDAGRVVAFWTSAFGRRLSD